ncbi:multidrug DMT transporter permease [Buchnera aphidicola (Schlechtendalia chinensis)]|uniref:Multidrug DMT transporter permease n=1 Tax=Buchnera aphidicola subsp. Schlechtendalia chinensis TaxID=118110 RepID=A0A172WEC2_BUCSC|nr:DMT family transporter [Buchnera aphidicola]ANF17307.1 multidrug DMT transporter permease [Buchnera aphidicola (Schlechtendalia chinensis)]
MRKTIILLLFIIVSITWGTTFIAIRIASDTIPPLCITGMRFLLASFFLIFLCFYTKTPLLFPSNKKIFQLIICIFYFSLPFLLILYGGRYVNSTIASVIFAIMPIIVLFLSFIFFNKKLYFFQFIGLVLAIIFLSIILFKEIELGDEKTIKGVIALLLAMTSHAIIYLYSKEKYSNISILTFNALPSLLSGLFFLVISNILEHPKFDNFSNISILATFYLSYFSGVFGILSYFYLQKKVSAFQASTIFFIFPIINLMLEEFVWGNSIGIDQLQLIVFLMSSILITIVPFDLKNFMRFIKNFKK